MPAKGLDTARKIVIVGAGPVGCYTAQLLKIYGFRPLLIEEHSEVGRPIHCTGLVGNRVFEDKRPFSISSASIINTINGAVINYDHQHFTIERKKVAYVIDREKFDKELSKGLEILYQNKFLGLEKTNSGYLIETDKDELFADIVIGADGANSGLRRFINQDTDIQCYKGVQFRIKTKPRHKDFVELYLMRTSFFWIVPEREDIVRVGTISGNPYNDLQEFIKKIKIKGRLLERFAGVVAIGVCRNSIKDNIALVGDAACQIKPLTYGGIFFGLKAAAILSECIKDDCFSSYEALWKKELAWEIKIGLKAKAIYNRLDTEGVKKIFNLIKEQKSLIEKVGDFENHSRLILEIIKKPSLYPQIGELSTLLFKKII